MLWMRQNNAIMLKNKNFVMNGTLANIPFASMPTSFYYIIVKNGNNFTILVHSFNYIIVCMNAKYPIYVTVTFDYNVSFVYVYFSIHISVFQYANEAYANEWDKNEKNPILTSLYSSLAENFIKIH